MNKDDKVIVIDTNTFEVQHHGVLLKAEVVETYYFKVKVEDGSTQFLIGGTVLPDTEYVDRRLKELREQYEIHTKALMGLHGDLYKLRHKVC